MKIRAYGIYIPKKRLRIDDFCKFKKTKNYSGISEVAVPALDDNSISMGINSGLNLLESFQISPDEIDVIVFGTTTSPFYNKSAIPIIVEALGIDKSVQSFEISSGIRTGLRSLVLSSLLCEKYSNVLCIVSECFRLKPSNFLDVFPSSGSVAFLLSSEKGFAEIEDHDNYTVEFIDYIFSDNSVYFDRRSMRRIYVDAYIKLVQQLMEKGYNLNDFECIVPYIPDLSTGMMLMKQVKVSQDKVMRGFLLPIIGNMFSVLPLLGVLKAIEEGSESILCMCCGSGGGEWVKIVVKEKPDQTLVSKAINTKEYIDIHEFLVLMGGEI